MAATIKLTAIRTQAGWDGMTGPQQEPYEGRHYDTISAWELTIPADLVFANEQWVAHCYDDWPGSVLADTIVIASRTTDTTRNVVITTPDELPPPITIPPTGFIVRSADSGGRTLRINCANTVIRNICVEGANSGSGQIAIGPAAANIKIHHNIVYIGSEEGYLIARLGNSSNLNIYGNFLYGGFRGINFTTQVNLYDNTFAYQSDRCFYGDSSSNTYILRNNIFYNPGNICIESRSSNLDEDYNATTDETATSPNSIQNITSIEFEDEPNNDFHLAETSQLRGAGENLIESTLFESPHYDIDHDQWPDIGPWDIGFDYYVGGEPPVSGGIKLGAINIDSVRVGVNAVDKAMLGSNQVLP